MNEMERMKLIQIAAPKLDMRLFRNNVGQAFQGDYVIKGRDILIKNFRRINFGLCEGSSDLIGFKKVTITPDMVGRTLAVFSAVEVKTPKGKKAEVQMAFIDTINHHGGIGIFAREESDLDRMQF